MPPHNRIVTAEEMYAIEGRIFEAGMPVAALMEKVGIAIARRVGELYPDSRTCIGIIIGPGHNGGDGAVVARELYLQGYRVILYRPLAKLKDLTTAHTDYALSLGIPCYEEVDALKACDLILDGLFGFGQTRPLEGNLAAAVEQLNSWPQPVISIDLPSGIETDTGAVLGTAIKASRTFCLGLWKRAFFQDKASTYTGIAELIDFGIPDYALQAAPNSKVRRIDASSARQFLPLPRPSVTHKYKEGHLLLIGGSRRYSGGIILTGLGARASGVGMLSIAVPESLKPILVSQLPEALIIGCPETETGAIAQLPPEATAWDNYSAIACGPGLTTATKGIVEETLQSDRSLVLDADGLNILAEMDAIATLSQRQAATVLTPHPGEFKRLFPSLPQYQDDSILAAQTAAKQCGAIVVLKAHHSAIAHADGTTWLIGDSTPALARGGSGDVLTGMVAGLLARESPAGATEIVAAAAWWHARAGIVAASDRSELGVDAYTLTHYLAPAVRELTN